MMVSANEIHHTIRKASLAIGLDHDRATDIGAAVVWLARHGQDGCAIAEAMLAATDTAPPLVMTKAKDQLKLSSPRPAIEGIAAIDWLIANPDDGCVVMSDVSDGVLLLGLLGVAAGQYNSVFQISVDGKNHKARITMTGCTNWTILSGSCNQTMSLTCLPASGEDAISNPDHYDDLIVAKDVWEKLAALAYRTYVPSSEQSRLSGAGAGLNDND